MKTPKTINLGRMKIYPDTPPPAPPAGPRISEAVREALKDQPPEIRRGVLDVADSK
jgi:hypothetical protein